MKAKRCRPATQEEIENGRWRWEVGCLVMSRVVGYITDVNSWNIGKKKEWEDRTPYLIPNI